jgi:hypothetical protein
MTASSAGTCGGNSTGELDLRRVQGYVLEIIISAAVPLIEVIVFSCPCTDVPNFVGKYKIKYAMSDRPNWRQLKHLFYY